MTTSPSKPAALPTVAIDQSAPEAARVDTLVVGVFSDGSLAESAAPIAAASGGALADALSAWNPGAEAGGTCLVHCLPGIAAKRLLIVSLGKQEKWGIKPHAAALTGAGRTLASGQPGTVGVALSSLVVPDQSAAWNARNTTLRLLDGMYRFDFPSAKPKLKKGPDSITLLTGDETPAAVLEAAARQGAAIAEGMALAKDLGNLPGNVCNPEYFAETARGLAAEFGIEVDVLERDDMERLGMGSFLSVGRASANACKFVVMRHMKGGAEDKPVVLVGKGITFDTGGISLKPGANLDEMKYDMSGAGAVFGTMRAAALLDLPINLVALVPAAENMPGGRASRPGDVVRSMSGQTIEILNTDAEGRLILCDALTYAGQYMPECVIDIATLTGACVVALGHQTSGLFANNDALGTELFDCGLASADAAWLLPLWDEYQSQLKSHFADMANLGGSPAGSVTAACFLSRFADAFPWAHLDIAGTASVSGDKKGSTGRPVPLLAEFLLRKARAL